MSVTDKAIYEMLARAEKLRAMLFPQHVVAAADLYPLESGTWGRTFYGADAVDPNRCVQYIKRERAAGAVVHDVVVQYMLRHDREFSLCDTYIVCVASITDTAMVVDVWESECRIVDVASGQTIDAFARKGFGGTYYGKMLKKYAERHKRVGRLGFNL